MNAIELGYQKYCQDRFRQPSTTQIAELEGKLGVELPADYKEFLLRYNGGYFEEPDIVPPENDCPLDRLTFLCGIGATDETAELASPRGLGLFDKNLPCQILPIGYTLMGNMIILITHSEDNGCIVLKKAFTDETFYLAGGIEGFFELLQDAIDE